MSNGNADAIGPIDHVLLEFPDRDPTGETAAALMNLVDAGTIRVFDITAIRTAVSGRVARHQAEKFADRDQAIAANRGLGYAAGAQATYQQLPPAPAPRPAAPQAPDMITQLRQLGELRDQGILTEDEFAAQKAKILAG